MNQLVKRKGFAFILVFFVLFGFSSEVRADEHSFISTWDTTKPGTSNTQVKLPLESSGTYNFTVQWGDGTSNVITQYNQPAVLHTYPAKGTYTITINGTLKGFCFYKNGANGDNQKITDISQWGTLQLGNSGRYFEGTLNLLSITATDTPNFTETTNMYYAFSGSGLTTAPHMNEWDMSHVTNMRYMFSGAHAFNQPIGEWNVSRVRDMNMMFHATDTFNQPLDNWNVSSVTDMSYMFYSAHAFNQPLDNWDVSSVTKMHAMFIYARNFNQPLDNWDVSSVTDMGGMFNDAPNFNQPIGNWNVSSVTDMGGMFQRAYAFSTANYDNLLIGWAKLPSLKSNVNLGVMYPKYSLGAPAAARQKLIDTYHWTIADVGTTGNIYFGDSIVNGISIKNPPSKINYIAGDLPKLNGMIVTIRKTDGTSEDVSWDGFDVHGIGVNPSIDSSLTVNNNYLTITIGGYSVIQKINVYSKYLPYFNGFGFSNYGFPKSYDGRLTFEDAKKIAQDVYDFSHMTQSEKDVWVSNRLLSEPFGYGGACFGMSLQSSFFYRPVANTGVDPNRTLSFLVSEPGMKEGEPEWRWDGKYAYSNRDLRNIIESHITQYVGIDTVKKYKIEEVFFDDNVKLTDYILILREQGKLGGHAVIPYEVLRLNDHEFEVKVYDPNFGRYSRAKNGDLISLNPNNRTVYFTKEINGQWKRSYYFNDIRMMESLSPNETFLQRASSYDFTFKKLIPPPQFINVYSGDIADGSSVYIQDEEGHKSGFVNGKLYQEIPAIYAHQSIGQKDETLKSVLFIGNIAQDLSIIVNNDGGEFRVLKMDQDFGYVQMESNGNTKDVTLFINQNNREIKIGSSNEMTYNIEFDGVKNMEDHVLKVVDVDLLKDGIHNYSVDWSSIFDGGSIIDFGDDSNGDGIVDFAKKIDAKVSDGEELKDLNVDNVIKKCNKDCKLYKEYKKEYKSEENKKTYTHVKDLKKSNRTEYERVRSVYETYKKKGLSSDEIKKLGDDVYRDYKLYKQYRGYKLYLYYKDKSDN